MSATKKRLVIVGASAMGREVCAYARESGMAVKGFLDSRADILGGRKGYPPILGPVESYQVRASDVFVCAVGDPGMKRRYAQMVREKGGCFVSIIHPTAYIGMNVEIGAGCIVAPHASVSNDTVLGDHVIVNLNASISHDNCISTGCTISPGCHLAGWVALGEDVFVGIGASIIPHVSIGRNVVVAAGAVVVRSVATGRVMGVPARKK